eukprot:TRINITY_DN41640_c0_g1_i1.p1 TRINITY_DN41640_c0_g1~~TRINITY_DN41640_c0_g1_i1.p1  ORF type:complete len:527 (+),score=74.02 TRINITY_DN41640_c0_g1_i1:229-1809(+)
MISCGVLGSRWRPFPWRRFENFFSLRGVSSSQFLVEASRILDRKQEAKRSDTGARQQQAATAPASKKLRPFKLERYLAVCEFQSSYLLSCSDASPWSQKAILAMADSECQELWEGLSLQYTESLGHPLFLNEVYGKYRHKIRENQQDVLGDLPLPPDYFEYAGLAEECPFDANLERRQSAVRILECVPAEGILMTMMAFLEEGDHVIVQAPAYQSLHEVARSRGCAVQEWRPAWDKSACCWRFDLEELSRLMGSADPSHPAPKMVILNSPHNPTGSFFTQAELRRISDMCKDSPHDCTLFVDEMYSDILQKRNATQSSATSIKSPLVSAVGLPNSIVLSGLSKPAGLPGLRTGWLVVENREHFAELCQVRDYTTICPNASSEILGLIALRNEEQLLQRSREVCNANFKLLQGIMEAFPDIFQAMSEPSATEDSTPISGCMTVYVPLNDSSPAFRAALSRRISCPEGRDLGDAFCEYLLQRFSLCAVPGTCFGFDDIPGLRFGLGRVDFPESLQILKLACSELLREE